MKKFIYFLVLMILPTISISAQNHRVSHNSTSKQTTIVKKRLIVRVH